MQKVYIFSGALLAIAAIYGVFSEPVLTKCSLARHLQANGIPLKELGDWLCIGKFASNYSGYEVSPPARDGTRVYGVFRISNEFWCESPYKESKNYCNVKCSELIGDDFKKAVECAKMIQKQAGFSAWTQWQKYCQEEENLPDSEECFVTKKVCVDVTTGSDVP